MISNLNELLLDRLHQQGVDTDEAHAFLRDLFHILKSNPIIDQSVANSKLQLLGWKGVTLDYQSLQLALAWMETGPQNPSNA